MNLFGAPRGGCTHRPPPQSAGAILRCPPRRRARARKARPSPPPRRPMADTWPFRNWGSWTSCWSTHAGPRRRGRWRAGRRSLAFLPVQRHTRPEHAAEYTGGRRLGLRRHDGPENRATIAQDAREADERVDHVHQRPRGSMQPLPPAPRHRHDRPARRSRAGGPSTRRTAAPGASARTRAISVARSGARAASRRASRRAHDRDVVLHRARPSARVWQLRPRRVMTSRHAGGAGVVAYAQSYTAATPRPWLGVSRTRRLRAAPTILGRSLMRPGRQIAPGPPSASSSRRSRAHEGGGPWTSH